MKDSKTYSRKVLKLYRSSKRKYPKVEKPTYDEPMDAIVSAIVRENLSEATAEAAMKRFGEYFVDLNELRVSRPEEIVDVIGQDTPASRDAALTITRVLRTIFEANNAVSLERLKEMGKRPAKQALEKMDPISHFVLNYCMLTALQGHAIPLTKSMIKYLRNNELVHPDADEHEIEGFLTRLIAADDAYEFYSLLRRESESDTTGMKRKTTRKKVTAGTTKKRKK